MKHPSLHVFDAIQILNPAYVLGASKEISTYVPAIPILKNISGEEWHRYATLATTANTTQGVRAEDWWTAQK